MKVSYRMIDRQLRLKGFIFNLFFRKSDESKFLKLMHNANKLADKAKLRRVQGIESTEEWITREDGTKLRLCIYKPQHKVNKVPGVIWLLYKHL